MKVKFQIEYKTEWGQKLYIIGSAKSLGGFNEREALAMNGGYQGSWYLELDLEEEEISYRYFLKGEYSEAVFYEFGEARKLRTSQFSNSVEVKDFWRSARAHDVLLYTSPFKRAFFHREVSAGSRKNKSKARVVRFQLRAPRIGKDYSFGVLGGGSSMGDWTEKKVHLMRDADFPIWSADVSVPVDSSPDEYKYVIWSHKKKQIVTWESGDNRRFPDTLNNASTIVITDEHFRYPVGNWKSAGVAIPVFSLRSQDSAGVGEFTDIKPLVDWSVKTGMKVIQILPVNDTIATHSWVDSYPYAAISVHALHPMYANMDAIGRLKDQAKQKAIDKAAAKLNEMSEVDYEGVMKLKSEFFNLIFQENKSTFLESKEFKSFLQKNAHWLRPYACFSYLRDKHQTPDFSLWDEYSQIDDKKIDALASPKAPHYSDIAIHYYIQYHLDRQLSEASAYARSHGVVLKGDIPIGIYRNSVDAWVQPELYNMDCQAGAPPDDFSVSGQNWGFPTYNWDKMAEDGFSWWKDRLVKMSEYFDIFRIDHILGFFRIWEIPWEHVEGIMGRFNPALPVHNNEFVDWRIHFDKPRFTEPYIRTHMIYEIFGNHAHYVFDNYLDEYAPGCYQLRDYVNTQRKTKALFDERVKEQPENAEFINWMRSNLYRLHTEVILLEAPMSNGEAWNPRIAFHNTYSYRELDDLTKKRLDELYVHFFYRRHNEFWRDSALKKLPAIKEATDMLIGGEDLGMVPSSVPGVMDELALLSLAIQRMPNDDREFLHPADNPYMSVCSTGSHDMSTLREWWQEDPDQTQRFYANILGHDDGAPFYCEPWVAKEVINQHLHSPSMLAIFPMQDLLAMDVQLRRQLPEEERINVPAISQHYWRYRLHLNMEELLEADDFNEFLKKLVDEGGRCADY